MTPMDSAICTNPLTRRGALRNRPRLAVDNLGALNVSQREPRRHHFKQCKRLDHAGNEEPRRPHGEHVRRSDRAPDEGARRNPLERRNVHRHARIKSAAEIPRTPGRRRFVELHAAPARDPLRYIPRRTHAVEKREKPARGYVNLPRARRHRGPPGERRAEPRAKSRRVVPLEPRHSGPRSCSLFLHGARGNRRDERESLLRSRSLRLCTWTAGPTSAVPPRQPAHPFGRSVDSWPTPVFIKAGPGPARPVTRARRTMGERALGSVVPHVIQARPCFWNHAGGETHPRGRPYY
jgi:hypothetical protein